MTQGLDYQAMLQVAIEEAQQGMAEGGIPVGVALFDGEGKLLGRGHYRECLTLKKGSSHRYICGAIRLPSG